MELGFIAGSLPARRAEPAGRRGHAVVCSLELRRLGAAVSAASILCGAVIAPAVDFVGPALASPLSSNTRLRRYLVTDSHAVLRYALPLSDSDPLRTLQLPLENIGLDMRAPTVLTQRSAKSSLASVYTELTKSKYDILLSVSPASRADLAVALTRFENSLAPLQASLDAISKGPPTVARRQAIDVARNDALDKLADIEEIVAIQNIDSIRIPRRYADLPRLRGRATVEVELERGSTLKIVLDGYSAPLTAGNFLDRVIRGEYDGASVDALSQGYYLQLSPSANTEQSPRTVPLEIRADGDRSIVYGETFDNLGLGDLQPALPATAYGAMAMAHSSEDVNDATSSFYIFMLDPRSDEARGKSVLNGNVSTFGYITEGVDKLAGLKPTDRILKARVIAGADALKQGSS